MSLSSTVRTAALNGEQTQSYEPQHVGEECESQRPANINAGTISLRTEWKHENRGVQHKSGEAEQRQTSSPKQSPSHCCPCLVFTSQAQVDEQGCKWE